MYTHKITSAIQGKHIRSSIPLTDEQMMLAAPSVFATEPYADRSERYVFTSTIDKINMLRDEGFFPFFVAQSKSRITDKRDHTKHMVRLRKSNTIEADEAEEIVLVNDSSGMTSDIAFYGLLRGVCQNGLIAGSIVDEVRIRHSGRAKDNVIEGIYSVLEQSDRVSESMDAMKSITLNRFEQEAFARSALSLRWGRGQEPIQAEQLLMPRRRDDFGNDLWTTLNKVQETLIRGGAAGRNRNGGRMTTRAVNGITENVKLNRSIWDLAEAMKALKTGQPLVTDTFLEVA